MLMMLKRRWRWLAAGAIVALAVTVAFLALIPVGSDALKEHVIALLSDELESEVTIERLEGRVFPRVSVSGGGMVIRHKGRTDVPPLIAIEQFEIHGSLRDLLRRPRRVAEVRLKGLAVSIPPGDGIRGPKEDKPAADGLEQARRLGQVIIERLEAPDTTVTLIPRRAGKQPRVFAVHHLVMDHLGIDQTMPYIATVTNPIPKGEIEASGTFGPWNVVQPARTPVTGKYTLDNARLDTIEGLKGTLRSTGDFSGPLDRIDVAGETETPDFQVEAGGLPVPLRTRFTAVVDGSDGDTYLTRVDAAFLDSELVATGAIVGFEGVRGRQIEIDVTMQSGRIEDLLRLAVPSDTPMLVGAAQLQAKLVLPPEQKKVIDRLKLSGEFGLTQAKFADPGVQTKLTGLSRRGRGMGREEQAGEVLSNLKGRFGVENAVVSFSRLTFSVPGAAVVLSGRYGMRSESVDFRGTLRMRAPLSQVAGGGIKGFFLKAFDPFFKEPDAGTVLPIKISGTRDKPAFGLDMF